MKSYWKSKKAFTLVELVVVIAVIAVLTAIAVPMVTGLISSATNAKGATNVQSLNTACQQFYDGIASGIINTSNFTRADGSSMLVPNKTDSYIKKYQYAKTATVADAMKYSGLDEDVLDGVVFDSKSLLYDPSGAEGTAVSGTDLLIDLNYR
ncbi:MAG: prepilin-type N-terminal cleavage/methylation domain-containing protein [Acutalibacteraceae bacterium]